MTRVGSSSHPSSQHSPSHSPPHSFESASKAMPPSPLPHPMHTRAVSLVSHLQHHTSSAAPRTTRCHSIAPLPIHPFLPLPLPFHPGKRKRPWNNHRTFIPCPVPPVRNRAVTEQSRPRSWICAREGREGWKVEDCHGVCRGVIGLYARWGCEAMVCNFDMRRRAGLAKTHAAGSLF